MMCVAFSQVSSDISVPNSPIHSVLVFSIDTFWNVIITVYIEVGVLRTKSNPVSMDLNKVTNFKISKKKNCFEEF